MCITIYFFVLIKTHTHIQTKNKMNQSRKEKNKRNQRRKGKIKYCCCEQYTENLMGYNDIIYEFSVRTFNLVTES